MIHITIVEGCSLKYLYIPLHIQNIFFIFIISGHFKLIGVTFYCSFLKYFYCFNQKYKYSSNLVQSRAKCCLLSLDKCLAINYNLICKVICSHIFQACYVLHLNTRIFPISFYSFAPCPSWVCTHVVFHSKHAAHLSLHCQLIIIHLSGMVLMRRKKYICIYYAN